MPEVINKKCEWCDKPFTTKRYKNQSKNVRFCSHKCYYEWKHQRTEKYRIKQICPICGENFLVRKWVFKEGKTYTCSKICEAALKSQNRLKENNPNWKDGASQGEYCPKFNRPFREGVREVWDHKCGNCGKEQKNNIIIRNGIKKTAALSIHHVHYKKDACCDGNEKDWMFIPLCHECHGKSNGNRKEWEEKFIKIVLEKQNGKSYLTETEYKSFFALKRLNPSLSVSDFIKSAYAG